MGIAYFPEIYEDELVYSVLARFYVHSGYPAYIYCAEDVFVNRIVKPDIEFFNTMKPEIRELLCRDMSMAKLVEKHTMFPYYARFLSYERRNKAFQALCEMTGNHYNLLPISKHKDREKRYLSCNACN